MGFAGREQEGAFKEGYRTLRNPDVQRDVSFLCQYVLSFYFNCFVQLPPDERTHLIVDSQVQTISGTNASPVELAGQFYGSKDTPTPVYLGEARTDDEGRLVVLAGRGLSFSIAQEGIKYPLILTDFDSPDWIDDTSDGWVSVTATYTASSKTFVIFLVY